MGRGSVVAAKVNMTESGNAVKLLLQNFFYRLAVDRAPTLTYVKLWSQERTSS